MRIILQPEIRLMQFTDLGPDVPIALALKTEWYPQCYTYAT